MAKREKGVLENESMKMNASGNETKMATAGKQIEKGSEQNRLQGTPL